MAYTKIELGTCEVRKLFKQMIAPQTVAAIGRKYHSGLGAKPTHSVGQVVLGAIYHEIQGGGGMLGERVGQISGKQIAESSLSERRQGMDKRIFAEIMDRSLRPLAEKKRHATAFYKGHRLLGIDGSSFSIANTAAVKKTLRKARSRRGKAAFAKIGLCVVSELGLHTPVAAAIGADGESEMALAHQTMERLPTEALLLGDRYYGVGRCISHLLACCRDRKIHFLFRARQSLKSWRLDLLSDGSWLVEVALADGITLQVREIQGRILARNGKWVDVRLWTNLLDGRRYPAAELLELYARRWEQEIATDELKNKLHGGALLKSQTPQTAAQELVALVMAQFLVAQIRAKAADLAKVPTLRASFNRTHRHLQALWMVLEAGSDLLQENQIQRLIARMLRQISSRLTPPRRNRSCPRAVRQPVSPWPRLQKNVSLYGEIHSVVTTI